MKLSINVIAPCYNHESFVYECLSSVAAQYSEDYDIHLTIIDDASVDDSVFEIEKFIKAHSNSNTFKNINFIKNRTNVGSVKNYNYAIERNQCDIIHFLNTDDLLGIHRLENIIHLYKNSLYPNYFWGFGNVSLIDSSGTHMVGNGYWEFLKNENYISDNIITSKSFYLLKDNLAISTGNIYVSSKMAKLICGFNSYKYVHDWDFILRCILLSEPINIFNNSSNYFYRHHSDNTFKKLQNIGHIESFEILARFFKNVFLGLPLNKKVFSPFNYSKNIIDAFFTENPDLLEIKNKVVHDYARGFKK